MKNDARLWETFPRLVKAVQADHIAHKAFGGHDFYHALVAAQYGQLIAPDEDTAILAWVAGLIHTTDRMYPKKEVIPALMRFLHLVNTDIPSGNLYILRAVLEHSKKNDPTDIPVTVVLKDADRLTNLGVVMHWLRAAQFRPNIPPFDPRYITVQDPTATFKDPKTVLRDIEHTLEWETWLRLPKAKELGKPLFDEIRWLKSAIIERFTLLGLYPFPPELVVEPTGL